MSSNEWIIDGHIGLSSICEAKRWHLASVIHELVACGLSRRDAEAFADFAFAAQAAVYDDPLELSPEQFLRLTVAE